MLVNHIAKVRDSVVLVLRVRPAQQPPGMIGGPPPGAAVTLSPAGSACYVGSDLFVTASHLFHDPDLVTGEAIRLVSVPNNGSQAHIWGPIGTVVVDLPGPDLAIIHAPGFGSLLPAVQVDVKDVPDGRSVFSYGFPNPVFSFTPAGPQINIYARACPSIISAHFPVDRYELNSDTYPGESGAPVFRCDDNALVGVVQATKKMQVPDPQPQPQPTAAPGPIIIRGPTVAGPLAPLAGELATRGVALLT